MITGDNGMTDEELREKVRDVSIFSRVVTEYKMRIVKAFRENGEIVAMTGDGVNDAPALKYADIGIAMGRRGSEVSREAGDLILLDDNFSTIVATIRDGRKIYDNIKKAVGYVFAIHIPVAFASLLAPILGIDPAGLMLLPIHVVLLELIIDPTSSIVLERQPAERDLMERAPRDPSEKILSAGGLAKSLLQGIAVFAASFGTYLTVLPQSPQSGAPIARAMGLAVIFLSNILLVQVNSPNSDFVFQSVKRLMRDRVMWAVTVGTVAGLLLILYTPISAFLKPAPLTGGQFLTVIGISLPLGQSRRLRRPGGRRLSFRAGYTVFFKPVQNTSERRRRDAVCPGKIAALDFFPEMDALQDKHILRREAGTLPLKTVLIMEQVDQPVNQYVLIHFSFLLSVPVYFAYRNIS